MIQNGLMKSRKTKILEHMWRERKHHFVELVQVDGSYHKWFNNEYNTLIAFIDDATSHLSFCLLIMKQPKVSLSQGNCTSKNMAVLGHYMLIEEGPIKLITAKIRQLM